MSKIYNRIIEYSFYALFLLTPLAFRSDTSELFELNKMWLTWGLTIIIVMSWSIKMILQRKFIFQRTPLDIPIGLFLISQIISTIFSLDPHTSLWGYYSRFNGGLLSIISYIFLYYAFLSNFDSQKLSAMCHKLLAISLISGLIVALWGLPSHFGYDPTCFIFRGTFDVSCWTADFLPKVRIFSTLGQPDWLAAYLAILIPIGIAYAIKNSKSEARNPKSPPQRDPATAGQSQNSNDKNSKRFENSGFENSNLFRVSNFGFWIFLLISVLFYVDLLYTRARSGFVGIWLALLFFAGLYWWLNGKPKLSLSREKLKSPFAILTIGFLVVTFIIGSPIGQLNKFTLGGIKSYIQKIQAPKTSNKPVTMQTPSQPIDSGITGSGDIRLLVWEGALNAWKANPIFGTGVETFAFAYYKYKPVAQNLTSEWDFLYNKAHNEYLNYLATTGIVGLGSYLLIIGSFLFLGIMALNSKREAPNPKQSQNSNNKNSKPFGYSDFKDSNLFRISNFEFRILPLALMASYVSILITNFFGFSVVITNVYLFMIPAFVFILTSQLPNAPTTPNKSTNYNLQSTIQTSIWQWTPIFFIFITSGFLLVTLIRFWQADISYALGANLDRALEYQQAYPNLHKAVELRGGEPVFKDELALNDAFVAVGLVSQNATASAQTISTASTLAQEAIDISNEVISQNSNNAVFWKTRTRLFYVLSQADSRYLPRALDAIEKASLLAPNDARIWYNLGVLYGQNNNLDKGISVMEKVIALKPNYREAHYALGLFYHTASLDKSGKIVTDENLHQKALAQMQYILDNLSPKDADALKSIQDWEKP
ncbi:MAG: putative bicarbonate transporter, IctB family [Candidatus Levybacteria bacterium]|nr:putative bicarbonate transporter, IctB family [Candidatus Levybacteria bacterium]